jgi:hypothetical protein
MEIFGSTITITLSPNTNYKATLTDQTTFETIDITATSDSAGKVTFTLPDTYTVYDGWFAFDVYVVSTNALVYSDSVKSTRPYVSASELVSYMENKITTAQAIEYERIARGWIDNILGYSFEFVRKEIIGLGTGEDTLWTQERVNYIYSVKYNNTDEEIVWEPGDEAVVYTKDYEYLVDADCGWRVIPQDIKDATCILVNDIYCGNNRYSNKYLRTYGDGTHNMTYLSKVFAGTGNLIVDNILSKYVLDSVRVQVM